ncbi:MAG: hypothetical protein FXF47_07445, partial [Candidatus Mcinerneyibacterium aminivorans]
MGFFKPEEKEEVSKFLTEKLNNKVRFDLILNKNEIGNEESLSSELFSMFQHIESLSGNIEYEIIDSKKTSEAVYPAIKYKDLDDRIIIYGVPSGYEFGVFLE